MPDIWVSKSLVPNLLYCTVSILIKQVTIVEGDLLEGSRDEGRIVVHHQVEENTQEYLPARPVWTDQHIVSTGDQVTRARTVKLLRSPRIDSKEPIPPGCVVWRAGTATLCLLGS